MVVESALQYVVSTTFSICLRMRYSLLHLLCLCNCALINGGTMCFISDCCYSVVNIRYCCSSVMLHKSFQSLSSIFIRASNCRGPTRIKWPICVDVPLNINKMTKICIGMKPNLKDAFVLVIIGASWAAPCVPPHTCLCHYMLFNLLRDVLARSVEIG